MYFTMVNLICFTCFTTIFIQHGETTDTISLVVLGVGCILFVGVFVRFYFNPHPCGYFRYSFNKTTLAFSHYLIMIVFLISATVLIGLDLKSYAAMVPCGLMFLYTIIYRPYIDRG